MSTGVDGEFPGQGACRDLNHTDIPGIHMVVDVAAACGPQRCPQAAESARGQAFRVGLTSGGLRADPFRPGRPPREGRGRPAALSSWRRHQRRAALGWGDGSGAAVSRGGQLVLPLHRFAVGPLGSPWRQGDSTNGGGGMTIAEYPTHPADDMPVVAPDRTPPQDIAAEQCVLGGMLLSKDAVADVVEVIREADFYRPAHQAVFPRHHRPVRQGEPADAVTVAHALTGVRRSGPGREARPTCTRWSPPFPPRPTP